MLGGTRGHWCQGRQSRAKLFIQQVPGRPCGMPSPALVPPPGWGQAHRQKAGSPSSSSTGSSSVCPSCVRMPVPGDRDRTGTGTGAGLPPSSAPWGQSQPHHPAERPGEEGGGFLADNQLSRKRGGRGKPVPGTLQASPGEEVGEPGEGEQVPVTRLKEAPAPQQEVLDGRAMTGRGLRPSTSHPAPAPAH